MGLSPMSTRSSASQARVQSQPLTNRDEAGPGNPPHSQGILRAPQCVAGMAAV